MIFKNSSGNSAIFDVHDDDHIEVNITVTPLRTYTVLFDKNHEDAAGEMAPQTFRMNEYQKLTANAFTREGYSFKNWCTRADGSGYHYPDRLSVKNLTSTPNETVTLYAQWVVSNCAVLFDANGGAGAMDAQVFVFGIAQSLSPNSFTRENYAFKGWNTRADGTGDSFADGQSLKYELEPYGESVTFYAQWTPLYSVRFDPNGGTGSMDDQRFAVGIAQSLTPNAFSRQGYKFTGWTTQPDGTGDSYDNGQSVVDLAGTPGAVVTLYARWIATMNARYANVYGGTAMLPDCLPISRGFMPTLLDGFYYVSESVSYDRPIRFTGTTVLILGEGCVMNVGTESAPITAGEAAVCGSEGSHLIIYAEKAGSGQLSVYAAGRPAISAPGGYSQRWGSVLLSAVGDGQSALDSAGFFQSVGTFRASARGNAAAALGLSHNFELNGGEVFATAEGAGATAISAQRVTVNGGSIDTVSSGDNSVALSGSVFVDINGGRLSAMAEGAGADGVRAGEISLGWTDAGNSVTASSYSGPVTVDDGQVFHCSGGGYVSGAVTDNGSLANQTLTPANIIVTSGEGGSVTADTCFAAENATVTLTVAPEDGYALDSLTVMQNDTAIELDENLRFTMPAGLVNVTATFKDMRFLILADPDERWEIQIANMALAGTRVSFTAEIALDYWGEYELTEVLVTDALGDRYTVTDGGFIMPECHVWVTPVFAQLYPITFVMGEDIEVMMVQTDSHAWSADDARAMEGETVHFEPFCMDGDTALTVTVAAEDGTPVACEAYSEYFEEWDYTETGWRFVMPDMPVTVTITAQDCPVFGPATFTLPAALTTIEESAFEGMTAMTVVDASHCTSIGQWAFKGCTGLTQIRLPANCAIDAAAFDGCGTVFIFAPAGGTTAAYCQGDDNPCVFVEDAQN